MIGQHLSRLAESQVLMLRDVVAANPELADERQLGRLVEHLAPDLEQLQDFVWRRHLAAYSVRMLVASDEEIDERRQVVGFADMVGFTSLTRRSTEAELVAVVDRFDAIAAEVVADNHGRIVKMLGDEVLFVADSPADGAEIALALLERAEEAPDVPSLRAGLALGRVLNRFGDVYGAVVNIAARLTSIARPGTVLIDRELAETLHDEAAYTIHHRRPTSVRGYARLRSASLRRAGEEPPSVAGSAQRIAAELLGLVGDDQEDPHIPLEPDDEDRPRRRRRRRYEPVLENARDLVRYLQRCQVARARQLHERRLRQRVGHRRRLVARDQGVLVTAQDQGRDLGRAQRVQGVRPRRHRALGPRHRRRRLVGDQLAHPRLHRRTARQRRCPQQRRAHLVGQPAAAVRLGAVGHREPVRASLLGVRGAPSC